MRLDANMQPYILDAKNKQKNLRLTHKTKSRGIFQNDDFALD